MNAQQYEAAVARIEVLIATDPGIDSPEGRELDALVEEVVLYEKTMWPFGENVKDMIAELRGGYPDHCDFCSEPKTPDELEPEEGGQWACTKCLVRWAEEDLRKRNEQ
jgi:hypothetical protein